MDLIEEKLTQVLDEVANSDFDVAKMRTIRKYSLTEMIQLHILTLFIVISEQIQGENAILYGERLVRYDLTGCK